MGDSSLSIIVGEGEGVMARVVQLQVPVALGEDVDRGGRLGLLSKQILVVGEVV